ncbi:MAG: methyltransferase domain-containing protein [Solirubrobacterales bacterium]|nr:methyltransferase domain-containing protein [Solirubrobacterales bacterium]
MSAAAGTEAARERTLELLQPAARDLATITPAGYLDLLGPGGEPESTGATQDLMLTRVVPLIYERWWRPALGRVFKGATGPGMDEEMRIARLLLGLSVGHTVLDVACGPGNFTRSFGHTVGEGGLAVGIDASATMLERGARDLEREATTNVALIRGDATHLPFADDTFDAACCFAALHLFAEPFDALADMRRVLAPGGRIAIMTSIRRQVTLPPLKPLIERASGMRVFEHDEIVSRLQALGFTDVHQRVSGLVQFVGGRLAQ